ncbi:MAG TPA: hypothetical protein VHR66_05890 [Gemmataceae bacterium]|jgi:hypothetical protein|nr:hypothetical protein [Gemmataceae bacterium]
MFFRHIAGLLALVLGVVGFAACAAGAYAVWQVQTRLERANDRAFAAVDRGLVEVEDRVPIVKERVRQSKITTDEVAATVRQWAANDAKDRLVTALQIETRAATLAGHLQAADARLDTSATAVSDIHRLLEFAKSLGGPVDPSVTDQVLEVIAALRGKLNEADRAVDEVRRFSSPDGGPVESRMERVLRVLARVVLTLTEIDSRLNEFATRLVEVREEARQVQERTSNFIVIGALACYALLAWIAAGQVALSWWGCTYFRRRTAMVDH